MATYAKTLLLPEQVARLEERVAALERRDSGEKDEIPFFPTAFTTMTWDDNTTFTTQWETIATVRTAQLSIGLVLIGDQVSGLWTGGDWRLTHGEGTAILAAGTVPGNGSYQFPAHVFDLATLGYAHGADLKLRIQTRRTSGATTGGEYGAGGSIGCAPRYARLL